ncbi:MAG: pentapeptide repeat-containing protein [Pseudonocardiales bacterium]|nr:pentapeptide repeat-containing protein [Pseudonocardiales bacterium]
MTQQGQITDRFTKAIEQLGSEKLDVRLGAIYALERIAVDSKRDHSIVVEVLSAFVRVRKRLPLGSGAQEKESDLASMVFYGPDVDIQAVITVLGRLPNRFGVTRGDLSLTDLRGANLDGANLAGANLKNTQLEWATMRRVNLRGAYLDGANCKWAKLDDSDLTYAQLSGSSLQHATLYDARLAHVSALGADLHKVAAMGCNLSGARLGGADLTQSNLIDADLTGADLSDGYSVMEDSGAEQETRCIGANLSGARLRTTKLHKANLRLTRGLEREQLREAKIDEQTRLPEYM